MDEALAAALSAEGGKAEEKERDAPPSREPRRGEARPGAEPRRGPLPMRATDKRVRSRAARGRGGKRARAGAPAPCKPPPAVTEGRVGAKVFEGEMGAGVAGGLQLVQALAEAPKPPAWATPRSDGTLDLGGLGLGDREAAALAAGLRTSRAPALRRLCL